MLVVTLLGGCVRYDAPRVMVAAAKEVHGVVVNSAVSPYQIVSDSQLRAQRSVKNLRTHQPQLETWRPLASGAYKNWKWSVRATSTVITSWHVWLASPEAHHCKVSPCRLLDWNLAFADLYHVVAYLLGKSPLPLDLQLDLFPDGYSIFLRRFHQSPQAVPLEFIFWYPGGVLTDPAHQQAREYALVHAVSTVGYEFQHVEYAAGETAGPPTPLAPHLLKDEANSACWRLASRLVILSGRAGIITIRRITYRDMALRATIFGNIVRVQNASLWGPVLLHHDLGKYLMTYTEKRNLRTIQISGTGYVMMNHVLAYCRGFTRYGGDIAKNPMPITAVARTPFWRQPLTKKGV